MTIERVALPEYSLISNLSEKTDYYDSYKGCFQSKKHVELNECFNELFFWYPRWVDILLKIRKVLVSPFKLKDGDNPYYKTAHKPELRKGSVMPAFTIADYNGQEVLLAMKDRHLDAYISVLLLKENTCYEVTLSTKVKYHNTFGRFYFFIIKPFHMIIVGAMLQNMINRITK